MDSLGERLRKLRERRGWSQLYVAQKTGISNFNISNYERGTRMPDTETVSILSQLYEVSMDYIVHGDKSPIDNTSKKSDNSTYTPTDAELDPEWAELYEQVKKKGSELEATAILRSASKMSKVKLQALLQMLDLIEKDDD